MSLDQFLQYLISGLTSGSIYALVGLGFTIIFSVTGIINFAQGEFVMLGGMLSYVLWTSLGLSVPFSVLLAVLTTAVIGAVVYLAAIRTARKASVISLIIITIGAAIFIRGIAGQLWTKDPVRPPVFSGEESLSFLGAYIQPQALWIIGTVIVVGIIVHLFFSYSVLGKALKACAVNKTAANLVGINAKTMAMVSFVLAATIGALGGAVMAPLATTSYGVGVMLGVKGFVAASIGGFKSQLVTVLGGILIGVVEALAIAINWGPFTSAYKDAIAIVVLLIILVVRSGGLAREERVS